MTEPLRDDYRSHPDRIGPTPVEPITPETVEDYIDGIAAFLGGTANVIMQLSLRPVGRGVLESTVDSGKVTLHPIKRLRTTLSYLAVALMGSEDERTRYRDAVDQSHRAVRSTAASPVQYNAFDPALQLWVAACLYWGIEDLYARLHGPMKPDVAEAFYRYCARLGTTLQMQPEMWPADRAAFHRYWDENLPKHGIEPALRDYFNDLIDLKMLPRPIRFVFAGLQRFIVVGLLPQHLRDEMRMTWTEADQRRFDRMLRTISAVHRRLPKLVRMFPLNAYMFDVRRRIRSGKPLV
ncbi:oxygenase MpaB family protein [Nocardia sp. NBC_00565]|uniref:oxygenase MpaB family protein n=1 Tax=Nocardia sp. NBC_00565 TaxID=2975993 RepID=UPI002E800CC1|nr:oxygenase MpaB family protein [Nocardia sp. NBC_00565]WUC00721.1 oxygenase MpaB family protein [Nocardia sp. NBC_00565]